MATVELERRLISGKGLLLLDRTAPDYKKAKLLTLFVDVVREPVNMYLNYNYNPPESRFCTLQFIRRDYVVRTEAIKYPQQSFDFYPEPGAQSLLAIECAYSGMLQSYVNLGSALGLPITSITNHIEDWVWMDLFWDTIKVVCYADTAVQLSVVATPYDLCPDQIDKEPSPPPPPPISPPSYPPGTPLADTETPVDDAYDGVTDDGNTEPFPGDVFTPPPDPIRTCTERTVVISYRQFGGSLRTASFPVFGEIGDAAANADGTAAGVYAYGSPVYGACTTELVFVVIAGGTVPGEFGDVSLVSITPPP